MRIAQSLCCSWSDSSRKPYADSSASSIEVDPAARKTVEEAVIVLDHVSVLGAHRSPVAATAGVLCPLVLERMGRDPVMGSSILLTGITDSMGFLIFLGLATAFLL